MTRLTWALGIIGVFACLISSADEKSDKVLRALGEAHQKQYDDTRKLPTNAPQSERRATAVQSYSNAEHLIHTRKESQKKDLFRKRTTFQLKQDEEGKVSVARKDEPASTGSSGAEKSKEATKSARKAIGRNESLEGVAAGGAEVVDYSKPGK